MTSRKIKLAYLVTHPIQYQAPLLKRIAREPDIDLTAFFCSDLSVRAYQDPGFGVEVKWDVPLLDGYQYKFLKTLGRTDLVSSWRPFNFGLLSELRKGKFDVLWMHGYARPYHWYVAVVARLLGIKVLVRDEATDFSAARGPIRRQLKRIFFWLFATLCNGFLAIGTSNRQYYLKNGIPAGRIFNMPYAVDNAYFSNKACEVSKRRESLRASLGLTPGCPVILFASKLTARKRPDLLLDAYARLLADWESDSPPYLIFIGDGELRPQLERQVSERHLSTVKILGFANQSELPAYFDLCDVFVLPSVHEPWGLVVNEAMCAGRAVIVSDKVGCAADLVHHLENGYVFREDSVADLQKALLTVIRDSRVAAEMGSNSHKLMARWDFEADVVGLNAALRSCGSSDSIIL